MSNNITPSKEARVPPQSSSKEEEKSSVVCPYCDSEIDHLMIQTITFHEFRLKNGEPEISPASFDEQTIFYCPMCGEEIASTQEDAIEFLKGKHTEEESLTGFITSENNASENEGVSESVEPEKMKLERMESAKVNEHGQKHMEKKDVKKVEKVSLEDWLR
jgi:DNA-directed RNA polymerase subunit RPC12/RpoP